MSLLQKMQKASTLKEVSVLDKSSLFSEKDTIKTDIPVLNLAFSGHLDGGYQSGLTMFAGPSKHFKTLFGLIAMQAYLKKYPDAVGLFYDSEFGTPKAYFESLNIPTDRVIHLPIVDIEELTFDIVQKLNNLERGERVFIFVDSIGNLASKKETQDALDGKSVADMTRAKMLKSLFRIVTPQLTKKDIPMFVINHTYKSISFIPSDVVGGGTGSYYAANNIYIIGRQQEKSGKDLDGYNFVINVEKSRFVKEKSKLPVTVLFDEGLSKWSGLLDIALETGHVIKPKNGWYQRNLINVKTGEEVDDTEQKMMRKSDTNSEEFWKPIFEKTDFKEVVKEMYMVGSKKLMEDQETDDEIGGV